MELSVRRICQSNVVPAAIDGGGDFDFEIEIASVTVGGGIGIGLLGGKAAEATGRNPGAATPILVISIILAALIEGIFILSAFAVPY